MQVPLQPAYVLRGHAVQVHAVHFLRQNSRLLTGDADGWVVLWDVTTKRAVAVWRAHEGSVLGLGHWGEENIVTHGRDASLKTWQLRRSDEAIFSMILPVDDPTTHRKQPWLLHSLSVNTLNFCSFSMCLEHPSPEQCNGDFAQQDARNSVLLAVPGTRDAYIDVFQLPTERRLSTIPALPLATTNMVMTLCLVRHTSYMLVVAGYDSGHTAVHACSSNPSDLTHNSWSIAYINQSHTQPVLSLDVAPSLQCYYTSSADDIIARHPISLPSWSSGGKATVKAATAPALKQPEKVARTKHSGQQALRVRSDGKIFTTAGWDGRVRVYSAKTMKELAVLKWHQQGCYALALAEVGLQVAEAVEKGEEKATAASGSGELAVGSRHMQGSCEIVRSAQQRRDVKAQATHWLAAGSKDGKVSLWNVY